MEERLKTAEIKVLLKECVEDGKVHPIDDFKWYITERTRKSFSIGQLSGAISQLATLGILESVERGLYRKGSNNDRDTDKWERMDTDYKKHKNCHNRTNEHNGIRQDNEMWRNVKIFLAEAEKELADIVGSANVWNLNSEEFELLKEVKELGERMNAIAAKC